ncbi:MAG: ATP-binding protein [Blastocatellia bacterium]|nr:ATP-binding protein [Blastocatellia bacterium]MCS7157108.1 ATP-binding protein [Blastocatellia bacterium]MCX7752429.1 ATP-binding protein [Blastocatellia bacterium]MDW8167312.1 ATP-binding protein [Acidobacteriota bacterium]MDW8257245.1 ATP-binding protein [Acidobacteriota bacterium]
MAIKKARRQQGVSRRVPPSSPVEGREELGRTSDQVGCPEEVTRTLKKLTALSSLAAALSRARELDPLLQEVLRTITEVLSTDMALIMLFDAEAGELRVRAAQGVSSEYIAGVDRLKPGEGVAGRVFVSGEPLVLRDAATDPQITRPIVRQSGVHAMACVPLLAHGRAIGVLVTATYDPQREITSDVDLLEAIGHQLGIAIENARLFEENLRVRKLWESTFNAIRDGISVHTRDLRVVQTNDAFSRLLGVPKEHILQNHCCMLMLGRDNPLPDCADLRATAQVPCQVTEVIERPNGQILRVTVDPLLDEEGRAYGTVHVVSDITEQVLLERRMARAEQLALIGEMAAGLAHEVKNPLAGIKGALEIILDDLPEDNPHRSILRHVLEEIQRINRIITDLLDYARPRPPSHVQTDVNRLIEHVVSATRVQLANNHIVLEFHPAPELPSLIIDPDELQKVVLNLLLNAIQAVRDHGHILVRTSYDPQERAIKLSVTDDGEGIPPENLDKIFRPFFTTKKRGTGLGLATCQRIVTGYGGTITVTSEVGKGSTFTVTLPLQAPPTHRISHLVVLSSSDPSPDSERSGETSSSPMRGHEGR